ncbi:MAG: hypothetical protein WDA09_03435 [Bacteriovoracaceae bacterium]
MNKCLFFTLFLILSCGRESSQEEEIFHLNEYIDEQYTLFYRAHDSRYSFEGSVQLVGAGLHLKVKSQHLKKGYLFLILSSNPQCVTDEEFRPMWNINSNFITQMKFENGYNLSEGLIKESYSYYHLMKFLRTPKKDFDTLKPGEKLYLDTRTLLFYYSPHSIVEENPLYLGCAEFHSA